MTLEIVDNIPAHTVEAGDVIHLDGEPTTVTDTNDLGDTIVFTIADDFGEYEEATVSSDTMFDLYADINDDEDI